jgi:putative ABC transport system permease protein
MKDVTREDMEKALIQGFAEQTTMSESEIESYISEMEDSEINDLYTSAVTEQIKAQYTAQVQQQLSEQKSEDVLSGFDTFMKSLTTEQCAVYYDDVMEFSDSDYETNLRNMTYIDLDEPSSINLYASSFENKDVIEDVISDYNEGKDELEQIKYTDYVGLMMSSVNTIIKAITYVLIAFVSISLIVSSIMIGVITLISVQERTKEIGILRAIGASKKNVCNMFNAETVMIGLSSGLLGIIITYLLCIPINAIIKHLTGIANLKAVLPIPAAIILVVISMLLTLLAGLIPSRSAAKKDPVVALRTE